MRLLIDEALSRRVAVRLTEFGHDAVHASDLDLLGAEDARVMAVAASTDRVLVSIDTDFGELLAIGRRPGPSVIILRRSSHRPEAQAALILANLEGVEENLIAGAVVVISPDHVRFRLLPIRPDD